MKRSRAQLSEYGPDLSRFATEDGFVSYVNLAPRKPVTGGKPMKKKKRGSTSTRVAAALRNGGNLMRNSKTALGAYYRQVARRIGGDVAVFATARKAQLIYRLLRRGQAYVDEGADACEKRYAERRIQASGPPPTISALN
jgi:transposase